MLGIGLQHKTVDELGIELKLPTSQLLGLFNRLIRCYLQFMNKTLEETLNEEIISIKSHDIFPVHGSIDQEVADTVKKNQEAQKKELKKLKNENFTQFVIRGSEKEWKNVLAGGGEKNIISVKW